MGKKHHRTVSFEDSGDSPQMCHEESEYKKETKSDEGECDVSDNDSDNVEFDDGYDEDLMGDDNDRALLSALTEVEREKELFKRMERREALKARHIIEKRLKAACSNEKKPSSSHDISNRRNVRPKRNLIKPHQRSLEIIRNKRMKRKFEESSDRYLADSSPIKIDFKTKKHATKLLMNKDNNLLLSPTSISLRKQRYLRGNFSEEDSEEEFDDTYQKKSLSPITTLGEFNMLRISRHKLSLWMFQPFFEHKIPGFFVRFAGSALSQSTESSVDQQSIYQAYEIVEVLRSNRSYKFGEITTNKYLRIIRGNEDRIIRMEYVSNQLFVESEFRSYLEDAEKNDKPIPTLETIEKKQADLKFCIEFRPTERDIDYIVEQKNKFRKVPVNITFEKHKIQVKIEEARQRNDMALVEKLNDSLKNLDEQLERDHHKRTEKLDKIRLINERNRRSNNAQLEKVLESESTSWNSINETANVANNPFVRRRTNPIILSDRKLQNHYADKLKQDTLNFNMANKAKDTYNQSTDKNSASNQSTFSNNDKEKTPKNNSIGDFKKVSTTPTHQIYDISKDLENLYNFDLDISLDLEPTSKSIPTNTTQKQKSRFP